MFKDFDLEVSTAKYTLEQLLFEYYRLERLNVSDLLSISTRTQDYEESFPTRKSHELLSSISIW